MRKMHPKLVDLVSIDQESKKKNCSIYLVSCGNINFFNAFRYFSERQGLCVEIYVGSNDLILIQPIENSTGCGCYCDEINISYVDSKNGRTTDKSHKIKHLKFIVDFNQVHRGKNCDSVYINDWFSIKQPMSETSFVRDIASAIGYVTHRMCPDKFPIKVCEQRAHKWSIISTHHFLNDGLMMDANNESACTANEVTSIVFFTNGHDKDSKHSSVFFTTVFLFCRFNTPCTKAYTHVAELRTFSR